MLALAYLREPKITDKHQLEDAEKLEQNMTFIGSFVRALPRYPR